MLQLTQLALRRGTELLLESTSLQIHTGQKVGVTGANGSGKSSLFSLLRGELGADAGSLQLPADWVIAHVAQQTALGRCAALDYVLEGDPELTELRLRIERAEQGGAGEELALLLGRYESVGGYAASSRAGKLLHGLGFSVADEQRAVDEFSGGWRMRLNLARALMCRSDLLLLDEPTNHLDLDAVLWLEGWLRSYAGTLLLISHDRDFLDSVVERIVHIERREATSYSGNYSDFERLRAEKLRLQQARFEKQQRDIAHMQSFVDRFRAKASKARQAQSRLKALERMQTMVAAHLDSPFQFRILAPAKLPRPLLHLDDVSVGYGDAPILENVRTTIAPGDRIGLLGPNGAGKSTLIKLLAGSLAPASGEIAAARDLQVGYFAQHQVEQLHPEHSPLDHFVQLDPAAREGELRNWLGGFGFSGDAVFRPTAPFSGGEKSRLALALLIYRRPNLLLLDEPTNHLDLEMRQALAVALQEFSGAMVIVSHDRHLLRVSTDTLMLVHGGKVTTFDGSLEDYPRWLASRDRNARDDSRAAPAVSGVSRKRQKRIDAAKRRLLAPLQQRMQKVEREMDALQKEKQQLDDRLADERLYSDEQKSKLKELLDERQQTTDRLGEVESRWLDACDELEQAADS